MFETFKLLNKFYATEAKKGQYLHKLLTYGYYFFYEAGSKIIGRNRMKFFLRHVSNLASIKMKIVLKDGIVIHHFIELYGIIIDVIVLDEYLMKNIPENKVIIDAGANIGLMSLILAKRKKAKKIYAFEPSSKNFSLLKKNIKENGCDNVLAHREALYTKKGKMKLYLRGSGNNSLILKEDGMYSRKHYKKYELVETTTLDICCDKEDSIYLLKIDVEGPEVEILEGADRILRKTENIIVEKSARHTKEADLVKILKKHGFKIKQETRVNNLYFGHKQ
ncbi:FkbM family methyltransferase [Candidatus Woesearchaeota archaeon]|nr:FkbM family methyltransferase [Candidatus Woesearchaeota archaeon]